MNESADLRFSGLLGVFELIEVDFCLGEDGVWEADIEGDFGKEVAEVGVEEPLEILGEFWGLTEEGLEGMTKGLGMDILGLGFEGMANMSNAWNLSDFSFSLSHLYFTVISHVAGGLP